MSVYGNVVGSVTPTPDTTLSITGKPADAKATGDAIKSAKVIVSASEPTDAAEGTLWLDTSETSLVNADEVSY